MQYRSLRLAVRTLASHAGNRGSNPLGSAISGFTYRPGLSRSRARLSLILDPPCSRPWISDGWPVVSHGHPVTHACHTGDLDRQCIALARRSFHPWHASRAAHEAISENRHTVYRCLSGFQSLTPSVFSRPPRNVSLSLSQSDSGPKRQRQRQRTAFSATLTGCGCAGRSLSGHHLGNPKAHRKGCRNIRTAALWSPEPRPRLNPASLRGACAETAARRGSRPSR